MNFLQYIRNDASAERALSDWNDVVVVGGVQDPHDMPTGAVSRSPAGPVVTVGSAPVAGPSDGFCRPRGLRTAHVLPFPPVRCAGTPPGPTVPRHVPSRPRRPHPEEVRHPVQEDALGYDVAAAPHGADRCRRVGVRVVHAVGVGEERLEHTRQRLDSA